MPRAMLMACVPWLLALTVLVFLAYLLLRVSNARLRLGRFFELHRDQAGSAQSLSFVLTLPIFIMIVMLIVQISQLMIGVIVVHYAAFAAARTAIVWIPADLSRIDPFEGPNRIASYTPDPEAKEQTFPTLPHTETFTLGGRDFIIDNVGDGPISGGVTYLVAANANSPKCAKILSAAVLACTPISPSRSVGYSLANSPPLLTAGAPPGDTSATDAASILQDAYLSMSPASANIPAVPGRLQNKLAYALHNTAVEIRFFHQNAEPPLMMEPDGYWVRPYGVGPDMADEAELAANELGRQDLVTVKVNYNLALLPGPGRLLAKAVVSASGQPDNVSARIRQNGTVYYYPLTASAALNIEGEKSVISYVY